MSDAAQNDSAENKSDDNNPSVRFKQIIQGMPKTELHLHIEGSLEPEMAMQFATKYNMLPLKIPKPQSPDDAKQSNPQDHYVVNTLDELKKVYQFNDLITFLNIYNTLATCIKDKQDFADLAQAFAKKSFEQNVIHCEIFFDPQTHTARGIPFQTIADGLNEGFEVYRKKGMTIHLICCMLRDHTVGTKDDQPYEIDKASNINNEIPTCWMTVKQAIEYNKLVANDKLPPSYRIIGLGIDNAEIGYPPSLFTDIYAFAVQNGLIPVAHAGEEAPPKYIWEALDLLKVARIDHGVQCINDKKLIARLCKPNKSDTICNAFGVDSHHVPLTCCPLSNYKLKVFKRPRDNNLLQLLDLGVMVTVNSDDPAYFGGYSQQNYNFLIDTFGASQEKEDRQIKVEDLYKLCLNGILASILDKETKTKYLNKAKQFFETNAQYTEQ